MDSGLTYFILGLVLAIPIGISANILTPKVQRWQESRPKVSAAKKLNALQAEFNEITLYHNDREKLHLKTISTAFTALIYFSIANAAWAFPSFFLAGIISGFRFSDLIAAVSSAIAVMFFLITMIIGLNHIRLITNIRNYDEYKKSMDKQVELVKAKGVATTH